MANVLITGGSGGLGAPTTRAFAEQGHRVFVLDIAEPPFELTNVTYIKTNISSEDSVHQAMVAVQEMCQNLDIIINMAGIYIMDAYSELAPDDMMRMLDINLLGAWRVNRIFLPLLRQGSRIVVVTSELDGQSALPFNGLYTMTKTALGSYTDSLRAEMALLGIRVIKVKPGAFATDMVNESYKSMDRVRGKTVLFADVAPRFQRIMERMGGKPGDPSHLASRLYSIAMNKHPRPSYTIRPGVLLKLYDVAPKGVAVWFLRKLLGK